MNEQLIGAAARLAAALPPMKRAALHRWLCGEATGARLPDARGSLQLAINLLLTAKGRREDSRLVQSAWEADWALCCDAIRLSFATGDISPVDRADWIQDRVISRAEQLELTAYAIAKATGGKVSEDHVRDYLTRKKSMGSHKLQHVLSVLGLEISER